MQRNAPHLPQVLYVEDDQISREVVSLFLKGEFDIQLASDSAEAIFKIKKNRFDVILMDINLCKGLGGLELAKEIKEINSYKETPIIAVTAHAYKEDERKILKGGCSHYISKPFNKESLLMKINEALNS
ncbi:MAG: response regulator [Ignavibacteria bacterium]|nr:response regulator [Ignavibacteria bacterium]MBT8381923.1 response regulator [Ignavibacteria bacterium]MBT8393144.1 response regulator [Ignavibacteria bacterium]NNJ52638.1 response regulator [Ignavibacteriaceae bacterium]NNL21136.1 response regulator [Ignavibacteriaceae bacterium]